MLVDELSLGTQYEAAYSSEKVELKPNDVFVMYFCADTIYQILTRDLNIRLNKPGVTALFYEI